MPELPKSLKRASQILDRPTSVLHHVYTHSRELLRLQAIVRQLVPGEIFVASCQNGTLHLITASSALATRLRYRQRTVINSLRQRANHWDIDNMRISVRPDFKSEPRKHVGLATPPSPENARHLVSTAKYIEDERLRKALIQLSRRGHTD